MNRHLSLYLDIVRFLAAMLVFFNHAQLPELNGEWLQALGAYGREAVMIFFVLSGYVIAHVIATKEHDPLDFTASRLARLYSVVLPALLLTVAADQIGRAVEPEFYRGSWYVDTHPIVRFLASMLFVNEFWTQSVRPFSNGPFWSISYEAAYYAIFGAWVFASRRHRVWLTALVMLVAGPKILLLFPIWLLGVAVYRLNERWVAPVPLGAVLFVSSFVLFFTLSAVRFANRSLDWSVEWLGETLVMEQLHYSKFFVNGYAVGFLVAMNFVGACSIAPKIGPILDRLATPIRTAASFTFSIYLFHYPLLHMFRTFTDSSAVLCLASLAVIAVLGTFTEAKKGAYRRFFVVLLQRCSARFEVRRSGTSNR